MRKVIAVIISIQLMLANVLPAAAQAAKNAVKETLPKAISSNLAKDVAKDIARDAANDIIADAALSSAARNSIQMAADNWNGLNFVPSVTSVNKAINANQLSNSVLRAVNQEELQTLLRNQKFLAQAHITSISNLPKAVGLWQKQVNKQTAFLTQQPAVTLAANVIVAPENQKALDGVKDLLGSISMLGLYGTAQTDAPALLTVYKNTANTPISPLVTATVARVLLRLKAYDELAALADLTQDQTLLWNGIKQFAKERDIQLSLPKTDGNTHGLMYASSLYPFGKFVVSAADPSKQATAWYMDLNINVPRVTAPKKKQTVAKKPTRKTAKKRGLPVEDLQPHHFTPLVVEQTVCSLLKLKGWPTAPASARTAKPASVAAEATADAAGQGTTQQVKLTDATKFQQASLYAASFMIGLEIGTPIMASLGSALKLSLEENILVAVATYLPYSLGAFFSDWLKGKVGRKASMNIGLGLMGGSFLTGATLLGLDGNFAPWANPDAHFWSILGAITTASLGGVFIHNAAGPIMTEISANATEFIRQKRGTFVELSRAAGMLSSYAFPFVATSMMGMDWSAPFLMALPFVGAAALGLNLAKLPNTRPAAIKKEIQAVGMSLKEKLKNNRYIRLFCEDKSVTPLLSGLFLMNAVETAYNSGFLLMVPSLTHNPSSQYLLGLTQFALPFVLGRYLASGFLKWFPKHNLSIASAIGTAGGITALGVTDQLIPLTAALFTAELGISTMFTLSFARTAKNPATQDRITSLIVASAVACAIGPFVFTSIVQSLVDAGVLASTNATATALIAIPTVLAMFSTDLFKRVERITGNLTKTSTQLKGKIKEFIKKYLKQK